MDILGRSQQSEMNCDWLLACHMAANSGLWVVSHQRGWDFQHLTTSLPTTETTMQGL